jgi:hypothetical protein
VEVLKFRETLTGNADGNPEPSSYEKVQRLNGNPPKFVMNMVKRKSRPQTYMATKVVVGKKNLKVWVRVPPCLPIILSLLDIFVGSI